ncbi:hypothetical protein [Pseudogemmobacter bohemicus]|uniref:hypothetical protein n=1 Tax=Pseudogemmobacter bohemicus TaxID=2250708 RepID=UPI0018E4F269|nr:hypothetical protein [Pseudogemmobacter bohemicus]
MAYRVFTAVAAVMLALALAACLPGLDKTGRDKTGAGKATGTNIITGDAIEATPLGLPGGGGPKPAQAGAKAGAQDAALPAAAESSDAPGQKPAGESGTVAAAVGKNPDPTAADTTSGADPTSAAGTDPAAAAAAAPADPKPAPPEVNPFDAAARLACEKDKGVWASTGTGFNSCAWATKDSGKRCTNATQCDGQCLARSGTCAPYRPLFGCNEILDDSGRRMTECLQ